MEYYIKGNGNMGRSKHSGGSWSDMPGGSIGMLVRATKKVVSDAMRKKAGASSTKPTRGQGSSYAQSVGKPMKKIKSAEDAVEKLRQNRGGRLP